VTMASGGERGCRGLGLGRRRRARGEARALRGGGESGGGGEHEGEVRAEREGERWLAWYGAAERQNHGEADPGV
jgi:hypothetical protein